MSAVLPSTSVQTQPRIDRRPRGEKETITLKITPFSLTVVMTRFCNQRCSLLVTEGPPFLKGFETNANKRTGHGRENAFGRCRAEIEGEISVALKRISTTVIAKLVKKSMRDTDAEVHHQAGVCYQSGRGVERNLAKAAASFQQAADLGHTAAQYELGCCYGCGQGVDKDLKKAFALFQKAAAQGHADAQYNLGCCYERGQGVDKDLKKAAEWYGKAAAQGQANAQNNLGCCAKGE